MYIAICDDRAEELRAAAELIQAWQADRRVSVRFKTFQNAAELLDAVGKEPFSLYLLDVMMPGTSGLSAAKEIRASDPVSDIVFLTSSPGFAYESYSVHATDYLLKPVRAEVLYPLLDRIYARERRPQDGLTLKCGTTLVRVPYSQLIYVETNSKHLYFNLTDGSVREVYGTLKEYEPLLLTRPEFMQTHRSYIVNMLLVEELSSTGIKTLSGQILPVSRMLYPQLQKDYMKLLFNRGEE